MFKIFNSNISRMICNIKIIDGGETKEYNGVQLIALEHGMISFKLDGREYVIISDTMQIIVESSNSIVYR